MLRLLFSVVFVLALTQAAVIATTVYLHRGQAHRSLNFRPIVDFIFRTILWIATGQNRKEWVAVHRKHHAHTDKEGDPHSPLLLGYWTVQIKNVFLYLKEARNPETLKEWSKGIEYDKWDRRLFNHGMAGLFLGISSGLILFVMFFGPIGLLWGLGVVSAHAILYVFVIAPIINALGHWWGKRPFDNTATNIRCLAPFTGGESLHNNHHAEPSNPNFSRGPLEIDFGWFTICILLLFHLATLTKDRECQG